MAEEKKPKKPKADPTPEREAATAVELTQLTEAALGDYESFVLARADNIWSYDDIGVPLNLEEQLFVRSYIVDRNEVAALRRIGHRNAEVGTLKARAKKYLASANVQEAIDFLAKRMMERLAITADKVQEQIAAVAFFDPREVMEFDKYGINLLHSRFWTREQAAAVKSIKQGANGVEIVLYDRLKANELLAKQLGVQPEDNDRAEAQRIAAEAASNKMLQYFERLMPPETIDHEETAAPDPQ